MNYFFLSKTSLFHGIQETEIAAMASCLDARERKYKKDEIVLRAGTAVSEVGLVLSGSVNLVVYSYWGDARIFARAVSGQIFAENNAASPGQELIYNVVASEDSSVLFLNMAKILTTCRNGCPFHARTIQNLLRIFAQRNQELYSRMRHTAPKSLRGRLLSYLSEQATICGSARFTIPFNRQQLADYLGVDRSAMSNELSKMQKEGLIRFRKNVFTLSDVKPF